MKEYRLKKIIRETFQLFKVTRKGLRKREREREKM